MTNGILLLTALPPTIGHSYIIEFARNFMRVKGGRLFILLCSRPQEPVSYAVREYIIKNHIKNNQDSAYLLVYREDVPQNPNEHPDFWNIWKNVIETVSDKKFDYVFASEPYGEPLAKTLDATFIPVDMAREVVDSKAQKFREDPIRNFHLLMPEAKHFFHKTVTFFGAESCGKTTISKEVSKRLNGFWVHEWARPYLEWVGAELTPEKMNNIVCGQYAVQDVGYSLGSNYPITFQDTDLFSTLGYYRLIGMEVPDRLIEYAESSCSDLYIVMNDSIPFEADPLRYGGNKRETNTQYWVDILDEFGLNYHLVKATDREEQTDEICNVVEKYYHGIIGNLGSFVRT